MDRSRNLRVEAYAFIGSDQPGDSTSPSNIGPNPSRLRPVGLLWNRTISMTTVPWSQNLTLPSFISTTIPCTARGVADTVSFPMVQGAAYAMLVKGAGGPGSVRLSTAMTSTRCPVGAYLTTQGTPPGISRCAECPAVALGFLGEMATCPGRTCSALVISGNYSGPYNPLSGANSIFGMDGQPPPGVAHYSSPNATIAWNASSSSFEMRDRAGRLMATRSSLRLGNFDGQVGWYNLTSAGPAGSIQAVGFELNQNENLNLCEIEMYGANGTNLLLSGGTCYSLPISTE